MRKGGLLGLTPVNMRKGGLLGFTPINFLLIKLGHFGVKVTGRQNATDKTWLKQQTLVKKKKKEFKRLTKSEQGAGTTVEK